jgi:uncharacterized membrane protein YbaN (DUF454 family)
MRRRAPGPQAASVGAGPARSARAPESPAPRDAAQASAGTETEIRPHASLALRALLVAVGTLSLLLGVVGAFTPVLPTTPFVLLAAACYARASTRLSGRLAASRTFGPMIREWRRHRSIPYRTKLFAIASMALSLGVSIAFFVEPPWLKAALAAFGAGLAAWMYRIPSRDAPARSAAGSR